MDDAKIGDESLNNQRQRIGNMSLYDAMDLLEAEGFTISAMGNSEIISIASSIIKQRKRDRDQSQD